MKTISSFNTRLYKRVLNELIVFIVIVYYAAAADSGLTHTHTPAGTYRAHFLFRSAANASN